MYIRNNDTGLSLVVTTKDDPKVLYLVDDISFLFDDIVPGKDLSNFTLHKKPNSKGRKIHIRNVLNTFKTALVIT